MRINLVFAPYVAPSCVPIGIASLKSYVEKNVEGVSVNTIDLSIEYVNKIVEGKIEKICNACNLGTDDEKKLFQDEVPQGQREMFRIARDFIKNSKLFYDKDLFIQYVSPLYFFVAKYHTCFSLILKDYLEGRIPDESLIFDFIKDEVEKAVEGKPELIGFSALSDTQINFSLAMAKIIKKKYGIPIVLGGPAFFNLDLKSLMEAFEFIDFIIMKEGEKALLELIKNLGKVGYGDVPNLILRRCEAIVFNREEMMIDLDELPTPDFSDLKLNDYYFPELILPISSSRNCPWNMCKFCQLNAQYGGKYRQRSIKKVIDDLKILKERHNASNFLFTDSEITPARLKEISQAISRENLQVYFGCYTRPVKDLTFEALKIAYEGGCRFLQIGVESLSDRYLKFVNKGTTLESILAVLRNTNKSGIKLLCYMLCGIPTQTREELLADMKRMAILQDEYDIFSVMYSLFGIGKNEIFYNEREKYGIEIVRRHEAFSTTALNKVFLDIYMDYCCEGRGAYDLLRCPKYPEINSLGEALKALRETELEFGINKDKNLFIFTINDFLFETQLLYSKSTPHLSGLLYHRMRKFLKSFH